MLARSVNMLLLRHGQSEWNAIRRWQGLADTPLTALGREQADRCGTILASLDVSFGEVWSSPLARAIGTARIVADRLGLEQVHEDDRLREADAGEWQGLTPDEIELAFPEYLATHRRPPTFESVQAVVERSLAALAEIAVSSRDADAVVVATHSGVTRSLVRHLGGVDERIPNLGGVWLEAHIASSTGLPVRFDLGHRFDPHGIVVSGVDVPGEDPGEQPDQTDAHGRAQG
jgi:broad specificity phosphatase PhoE